MDAQREAPGSGPVSRRRFLQTTTTAAVAAPFVAPRARAQAGGGTLNVGLVGCGGRGTGAAAQALTADRNTRLVAMADAFEDRLRTSLATLRAQDEITERIEVPEDRCFVGFDAFERLIASGVDVVLLATPPHFRPMHIRAAVEAGRHVFAEKPVAVDAPGVRSVLASCEEARRRGLSIVSGLALRYSDPHRELMRRVHQGAIGRIHTLLANDFRGPIWVKPRQPGWSDMEYHMRNWYYFTWLSGDFNVEQHIHMLDLCAWAMGEQYPVSAVGIGGRQVRIGPEYGNIYDHHAVIYEYADGARLHAYCRQQAGCADDISVHLTGEAGSAVLGRDFRISGRDPWTHEGERNNAFLTEHEVLFESIRRREPVNNGEYMAKSTLMAIMGRMATYTGQRVTWDQAMNSAEDLSPEAYTWDAAPPPSEVARPGITRLI